MAQINKEHFKINNELIAVVSINDEDERAEFGYYPIKELDIDAVKELKTKLEHLKAHSSQFENGMINIDVVERCAIDIDDFLRGNAELKRLMYRFRYCASREKVELEDGTEFIQTKYDEAYDDGLPAISTDSLEIRLNNFKSKLEQEIPGLKKLLNRHTPVNFHNVLVHSEKDISIVQDKLVNMEILKFSSDLDKKISLWEYERTIEWVKKQDEIRAYSKKDIGWSGGYSFELGDDYKANIGTNFGYGRSSYFYLGIEFRGVDLTPYSKYVEYYYAGFTEIHRYTVQAFFYDNEWGKLFEYLVKSYNMAFDSPDRFIKTYFIDELDTMVSTLEKWFSLPKTKDIFEINDVEVYVGDRRTLNKTKVHRDSIDFQYFQLEKISGALEFIESINSIKELANVSHYINRILALNKMISVNAGERIKELIFQISENEKKVGHLERELEVVKSKIDSIIRRRIEILKREKIFSEPDLKILARELSSLYTESELKSMEINDISDDSLSFMAETLELSKNKSFSSLFERIDEICNKIDDAKLIIDSLEEWKDKFSYCFAVINEYFEENLSEDYLFITQNGKMKGVVDMRGNQILPSEYENIYIYAGSIWVSDKDGSFYCFDRAGVLLHEKKMIIEDEYPISYCYSIEAFNDNYIFFYEEFWAENYNSYTTEIFDINGKYLITANSNVVDIFENAFVLIRELAYTEPTEFKFGVIDFSNNVIVPTQFGRIEFIENNIEEQNLTLELYTGTHLQRYDNPYETVKINYKNNKSNLDLRIIEKDYKKGLMNINGEHILPPEYREILLCSGNIWVKIKQDYYYYNREEKQLYK